MGRRQTLEDLEDATRHVTNEIQEVLESRRMRSSGSVLRNHVYVSLIMDRFKFIPIFFSFLNYTRVFFLSCSKQFVAIEICMFLAHKAQPCVCKCINAP